MATVNQTDEFKAWLKALKDTQGKAKIISRVDRLKVNHLGDVGPVGDGMSELKIDFGPGYRVYFKKTGKDEYTVYFGGNKSTQKRDIKRAKELAT